MGKSSLILVISLVVVLIGAEIYSQNGGEVYVCQKGNVTFVSEKNGVKVNDISSELDSIYYYEDGSIIKRGDNILVVKVSGIARAFHEESDYQQIILEKRRGMAYSFVLLLVTGWIGFFSKSGFR